MIFVTVGTHEQSFNRLIKEIDVLKKSIISEKVIIQTGFSTYKPVNCEYHKFISYVDMQKYVREARIVITHGGPASFIMPLSIGRIPIVVPRQKKFHEHVNDHQVLFIKHVSNSVGNIIPVYNIKDLKKDILEFECISKGFNVSYKKNNLKFVNEFSKIAFGLFE